MPTKNENFAVTVAEALATCVPAIISKGPPWADVESKRCGWWIDYGAESLAQTLEEALMLDASQRLEMGERGRDWISCDFSWARIASDMQEFYNWLLLGGRVPSCVEVS